MPWSDQFAGVAVLGDPNTPLVSRSDFAEWNGINTSDATIAARVDTALEIASAAIRNGRRIFTPINNETVRADGTGSDTLLLPKDRLPIRNITSIGEIQPDGSFITVDALTYDWDADGLVTLNNGRCWVPRRRGISVVYDHGYETLPRDVLGICLAYARRVYDDPQNSAVVMEQLGDYRVEYEPGGGLLPDELARLELYEASR